MQPYRPPFKLNRKSTCDPVPEFLTKNNAISQEEAVCIFFFPLRPLPDFEIYRSHFTVSVDVLCVLLIRA